MTTETTVQVTPVGDTIANHMPLFLGAITTAREGWDRYVAPAKAPANYKDPIKIQKKEQEIREKQAEAASLAPITGTIKHAVIHDVRGDIIYAVDAQYAGSQDVGSVSVSLASFLLTHFPYGLSKMADTYGIGHAVVGFNIKAIMRIMALEVFHNNHMHPHKSLAIPPGLWLADAVVDPFEKILPNTDRKDLDIDALAEFIGVAFPENVMLDPHGQASLARSLCEKTHLYFTPSD